MTLLQLTYALVLEALGLSVSLRSPEAASRRHPHPCAMRLVTAPRSPVCSSVKSSPSPFIPTYHQPPAPSLLQLHQCFKATTIPLHSTGSNLADVFCFLPDLFVPL